jgi:glycosyltransferase involved in cell wall biosynthesis
MSEPLVSVILPTYNRSSLLWQAVQSVRAQTYPHWELLVIDDGSSDDTPAVLSSLEDPRIRIIRLDHTDNPARVRNAGLAVARGDHIAFLDDDDVWLEGKLATQLRSLMQSGCRWGYTGFRRIDIAGREREDPHLAPWHPHGGWILEQLLRVQAIVPLPTVMVERTLLTESGWFDEALQDCEDYELWFRLAARSAVQVEASELACIRVHAQDRQANRERVHASWIAAYDKTAEWVPDKHLKALCRARRARHQVLLARILAQRRRASSSLGLLMRSATHEWSNAAWWSALVHSLLPKRAVSLVRALKSVRLSSRRA